MGGPYEIREKIIKLVLNSLYGKFAQAVGERGKTPRDANPYYAAAITANCRRRLMEAALLNPHEIVFFATDGIVSTGELVGLARVKHVGQEEINLGDWEYGEGDGGVFVMSGVYSYGKIERDKNGDRMIKPLTKTRGADAKRYVRDVETSKWLVAETISAWKREFDSQHPPAIEAPYSTYVTAGSAFVSEHRWPLAGRWSPKAKSDPGAKHRLIQVHEPGSKRRLIDDPLDWATFYKKGVEWPKDEPPPIEWPARRCSQLIRTVAATNDDKALVTATYAALA